MGLNLRVWSLNPQRLTGGHHGEHGSAFFVVSLNH